MASEQDELKSLISSIDDELGLDDLDEALAAVDAREARALENLRRTAWRIDSLACVVQDQHCLQCGNTLTHVVGLFVRESRPCDNGKKFARLAAYPGLQIGPLPRIVERLETELVAGCGECWSKAVLPQLPLNFDLGDEP